MSKTCPASAAEPSATRFVIRSSPSAPVSTTFRYVASCVSAALSGAVRKPVNSVEADGVAAVPVPLPTVYYTSPYCPVSSVGIVSSTR